jgi:predicted deacylase
MKNTPFSIFGSIINPGEHKTVDLPVPSLYSQTPMNIPIHVINGKKWGPRIFVMSAMHGDEINSVQIAMRLAEYSAVKNLQGTLIIIPIANVYGFITLSRYLHDGRDLNRMFPGSKTGSLASRLAYIFMQEIIRKCTHGIDLHTGRTHIENLPQIRTNIATPGALTMAKAFNVPVIIDSRFRDGSLRQAAAELKIPILVYEGGEALRFSEIATRTAVKGIINVLRSFRMIAVEHHLKKITKIKSNVARSTSWLRAPESGIVKHPKKLGVKVKKGEVLGVIANPFSRKEYKIIAQESGIIIGRNKLPCVNEGDALFHIASFKKVKKVSQELERLMESINIKYS